jgi:hypothetical protein
MKGEAIPNGQYLYKYIKPDAIPPGQDKIPFSIFNDPELSCDWEEFQKQPERSFHIAEGKNLILRITVCDDIRLPRNPKRTGEIVKDWKQEIIHDPVGIGEDASHPLLANPAHSLIKGPKKIAVTTAISNNSIRYKLVNIEELNNSPSDNVRISFTLIVIIGIIILLAILLFINFAIQ